MSRLCAVSLSARVGCTPLHFAAANGHIHIVKLLLANGADPTRSDKHGVRPEDTAAENGHTAITEILREASDVFTSNNQASTEPNAPIASSSRSPYPPSSSPSRSRILRVQRSIGDHLTTHRPSLSSLRGRRDSSESQTSPSVSTTPLGPGSPMSYAPSVDAPAYDGRRPSLPTLLDTSSTRNPLKRVHKSKRPSSAGEGATGKGRSQPPTCAHRGSSSSLRTSPLSERDPTNGTLLDVAEDGGKSMKKAPSKYSLVNLFKKSGDVASSSPSSSSDILAAARSSSEALVQPPPSRMGLSRALDETFGAPAFPQSKVANGSSNGTTRYRPRKSSEVAVSSPLAIITPTTGTVDDTSSSTSRSSASTSRARSTSVPVNETSSPVRERASHHHHRYHRSAASPESRDPISESLTIAAPRSDMETHSISRSPGDVDVPNTPGMLFQNELNRLA